MRARFTTWRIYRCGLVANCRVLASAAILCVIFSSVSLSSVGTSSHRIFREHLKYCPRFIESLGAASVGPTPFPQAFADVLTLVDHVFILSVKGCAIQLPLSIVGHSTCIVGEVLDKCLPASFVGGNFQHAMRVTSMHAAVLDISLEAKYRRVAVMEDDLSFVRRQYSSEFATDVKRLLLSASWSLIRLGYRPYFLQERGTDHCPRVCRCVIHNSRFGENFCHLSSSGCDLRSSDFYVVSSTVYEVLIRHLLDLGVDNSKRIVDVYPMRRLPNQWLLVPQASYQRTLDVPPDYQLGAASLFIKKCVWPRPVPINISSQIVSMLEGS